MRKSIPVLVLLAGAALAAGSGLLWFGVYDVGADEPHWRATHALLGLLRDRSIDARAQKLAIPGDLADETRVRRGAGNYAAMCAGCHLAPGDAATPLSVGLYPAPPPLAAARVAAPRAFWVIKHGIKSSGMAAWGKHMSDGDIWDMVAFVQRLSKLDRARYDALVAASGGHVHGPGEPAQEHHNHDHHDHDHH